MKIKTYLKAIQHQMLEKEFQNALMVQQIVCTNKSAFEKFRNMHSGKKLAVVATGPSLTKYVPEDDVIYVGVNKAFRFDKIKFDYIFCQDYLNGTPRNILDEIGRLDCVKFYGKFRTEKDIQIPESFIEAHHALPYYVDDCPPSLRIYEDICYHPIMNCFSVVFSALQFALFTNPKEIHLVGCDCSSEGYFDNKGKKTPILDKHLQDIYDGYVKIKEFTEKQYPDTKIISINPVGLKGLFEDRYIGE